MYIEIDSNHINDSGFRSYDKLKIFFKGYAIWKNKLYFNSEFDKIIVEHYKNNLLNELYKSYNGIFNLVIIEKNTVTVIKDRWGIDPLYYIKKNDIITISDNWCFLSEKSNKEINQNAFIELLTLGYVLGNDTLIKEIKEFSPHNHYSISNNYGKIIFSNYSYWSLEHYFPKKKKVNYEKKFANLWHKQLKIYTDYIASNGNSAYIPFSGGLDCRLIANELNKKNIDIYTLTYGTNYNKIEIDSAKDAIQYLGNVKDHYILYLNKTNTKDIFQNISLSHRITCAFPSELFYFYQKLNSNFSFVIPGYSGDFMAGSHLKYKMKFWKNKTDIVNYIINFKSAPYLKELIKTNTEIKKQIEKRLFEVIPNSNNPMSAFIRWDLEQRQRRYIARSAYINNNSEAKILLPYFDYSLMDFFIDLPFDLLWNTKLYINTQIKSLYKENPKLIKAKRDGKSQKIIKNNFTYEYLPKFTKIILGFIGKQKKATHSLYEDLDYNFLSNQIKLPDFSIPDNFENIRYPINKLYLYSISEAYKQLIKK